MPRVGLLFELRHAETLMGETIRVVGDQPALGNWVPLASASFCEALELRTSCLVYPRWTMRTPVWLRWEGTGSKGLTVEYKYVRNCSSEGEVKWEDRISNRRVRVPEEDGAIFLISDACWDKAPEPARTSRLPLNELSKRWASLDPDSARYRVRSASAWARSETAREARPAAFQLSPQRQGPAQTWSIEDEFNALSSPPAYAKAPPAAAKVRDAKVREAKERESREGSSPAEQPCGTPQPLPFILRRPGQTRSRPGYPRQHSSTMCELERLKDENRKLREASVEMLRLRLENGALRRSLGITPASARTPAGEGSDSREDGPTMRCGSQDRLGPSRPRHRPLIPAWSQDTILGPPKCTLPSFTQGLIGTPSAHNASVEDPQTPVLPGTQTSSSYAEESPEVEPSIDNSPRRVRPYMAWTARSPSSNCYAGLYGKEAWAEKVMREPQEEPSIP